MSLRPWTRGIFDPFSIELWDPFFGGGGPSGWLQDTGCRGCGEGADATALARANVDWRETDKAHITTAEIPEVKVEVEENNVLQISGQRVKEEEQKGDTWHCIERSKGSFQRRFQLPDSADLENIECFLENGVLTIQVPKKETDKPCNVRSIDIS
ncbi:class I heat shock protein 1-like protein [Carex littledalei]|uniref:Class I heat shock protein 1-like protein n=1 Tax=Carex littledalei TaxID=544730 RepID=A0A833QYH4_9POAL|nr:class I heat shock protein 1-like protein [Carex littledalei]